ncbi:MAG: hypothetical protein A2X94_17475 [Bdellovibrionales bacterium GWB1_55_8]|nr:MAG: hypothetical protein A2X94_17475 [Bdellovibrionales bacterium GWB1_55_8]
MIKSPIIDEILSKRRIIVTLGTGGVGKTTLSAALAMRAALLGRRAIVVTIDPAKRLATSLGLDTLGNRPTDLTSYLENAAKKSEVQLGKGRFFAMIPDANRNFQDFLTELAPSREVVEKILKNPLFQIFTKEFSGTNEYMALERLRALDHTGEFDCIILDTPPSRNALAFLNAPKLLARLFEERLIRWLVLPANKIVAAGMRSALGVLERLTGAGFMSNLLEFASTLFEVRVRFLANMKQTTNMLESESVGFIMVTAPSPDTAPEVQQFIQVIQEHGFHFDGVALNRTLGYLEGVEKAAKTSGNAEQAAAISILSALKEREKSAEETLRAGAVRICARVPELARDIHSVEDLFYVAQTLGPEANQRNTDIRD